MANSSFFKNNGTTTQIQNTAAVEAANAAASAAAALVSQNAAADSASAASASASSSSALTTSNNLSDVASASTSRSNLGLGTAAVLNTGTSAGNAVVLDGSARLPAVDGSQLTGLASGSAYSGWTVSDGSNSENIASTNTVTFAGSGATSVAYNTSSNTLTVSSTDNNTTYSNATTGAAGLMSATDKTKLDGIEALADVTDATNVTAAGAAMLAGATFTGAVTATSFTGDGANLTNLPVSTPTLSSLGIANHNQVTVTSGGAVTATSFSGNGASLTGIQAGGAGYFQGENGATGDTTNGKGDIFRVHESELNTNVTIAATNNAMCAGPLTVATGVTVTVNGNMVIA